jgi:hypothetical protein
MVDREQLRAEMDALREDIARRELELAIADEPEMPPRGAISREPPPLVFKTREVEPYDEPYNYPFTHDQIEELAWFAVQQRAEMRTEFNGAVAKAVAKSVAPLRDRISALEAQVSTLLTVLGHAEKAEPRLRLAATNDT